MRDGSPSIGNVGLYDESVVYAQLISGTTTGIATSSGTATLVLAGEMAMEAFYCLINQGIFFVIFIMLTFFFCNKVVLGYRQEPTILL